VISVKTQAAVPKELIFEVMEDLSAVMMKAPVQVGDVVIANVRDTGVDVIATRNA
jgi:CxxC motif-containing protein